MTSLVSIPGEAIIPISFGYVVASVVKHSHIQNFFVYTVGLIIQGVALAALIAAAIFPVLDDITDRSFLVSIAACVAALMGFVADAAFSYHYVADSTESDWSLTNRTVGLVSVLPIAFTGAALFKINFNFNLLVVQTLGSDSLPRYILLSLVGALVAFVTTLFAALWALFSPYLTSEGRQASLCLSRIWFSVIFCFSPVASALTGISCLFGKEFTGSLCVIHVIVSPPLIGMSTSLVKNMLKSTNPAEQREFFWENAKM